jgi:hypothetical protein
MKTTMIFFATAAVLIGAACNHESTPARGVTTTGAGIVANDDAASRLTDARCNRAKACNQLGKDEKYADMGACKREVAHDLESDLRPGECPRGIRQEKLSNCIQEIQNEKCGNLADKISRLATCRTGSLCVD